MKAPPGISYEIHSSATFKGLSLVDPPDLRAIVEKDMSRATKTLFRSWAQWFQSRRQPIGFLAKHFIEGDTWRAR